MKICVLGAGVAGIASAFFLAQKGYEVVLIESSNSLGGRVNSYLDNHSGDIIDNGQHLLSGAYSTFLEILDKIGSNNKIELQNSLCVPFLNINQQKTKLDFSILPNDLGKIIGLFKFSFLDISSKLNLLSFIKKLVSEKIDFHNKSVLQMLKAENHSDLLIKNFWEPMCLATLNTNIQDASAKLFLSVLNGAFFNKNVKSPLIFPNTDLESLFDKFEDWFHLHQSKIMKNQTAKELIIENGKCIGVRTVKGKEVLADAVVSALTPLALERLLGSENIIRYKFDYLSKFEYEPIISVFLWYNQEFFFEKFSALIGSKSQWIFNKRKLMNTKNDNFPAHYSITMSASRDLFHLSSNDIADLCHKEITQIFKLNESYKLLHHKVIKEKRATFKSSNYIDSLRPNSISQLEQFYLAGDWINTNLPATIESAALSGKMISEIL